MSCLNALPIRRLAGALRAVNIANCLLLITAAALGFGSLLGEAAGVQLQAMASTALVSVYVLGFSGLLLCYELRLGAERLYEECGFLFTMGGRCAFLLLTANLAWACGPWWLVAALVTNGNAALHAYLLISHPAYTSGGLKWDSVDEVAAGGGGTSAPRDPGALAQSAAGAQSVSGWGFAPALGAEGAPSAAPAPAPTRYYEDDEIL